MVRDWCANDVPNVESLLVADLYFAGNGVTLRLRIATGP